MISMWPLSAPLLPVNIQKSAYVQYTCIGDRKEKNAVKYNLTRDRNPRFVPHNSIGSREEPSSLFVIM